MTRSVERSLGMPPNTGFILDCATSVDGSWLKVGEMSNLVGKASRKRSAEATTLIPVKIRKGGDCRAVRGGRQKSLPPLTQP